MNLVKTSVFSAVTTFIKIAASFVASKIIAVFAGPIGVALMGGFSNFISMALTLSNGAINNGVIKYTAENANDKASLAKLYSTALRISLTCSIVASVIVITCPGLISYIIFNDRGYDHIIIAFALSITFYSLNSLFISIINGLGRIKTYTLINTTNSIVTLLLTIVLVYFFKVIGALYAVMLSQSIVFIITSIIAYRSRLFSTADFKTKFDKLVARNLSHYSLMSIITALTVPLSQILLRNMLSNKLGSDAAGHWQGLLRVSDGYLLLITTSLATYYLPKLSATKGLQELRKEIFQGYKFVMPIVIFSAFLIYFFRILIIKLLYTPDFLPMEELFLWQLVGDIFKIGAWILAYLMLAKKLLKIYILSEIAFSASYVALGYFLTSHFQTKGIVLAFAFNYACYFVFMCIVFRKLLFGVEEGKENQVNYNLGK